jgi:hypothetical protein
MKYLFQIVVFLGIVTYQLMAQVNYSSKLGNFTCSFPSKPTEEVTDLEDGTKFYQLQCINGEEIYMLFFANSADTMDKDQAKEATESAKTAFVDKLGAEVISDKTYAYNGFTGHEMVLKTTKGVKVYYRVIQIHNTLYQFAVLGIEPQIDRVNKFFNSFKYTGK